MFYGNAAVKQQNSVPKLISDVELFESVVYNEYIVRKNMLEACEDESERAILEAQVQVLQEVSFKDVIEKIKQFIKSILEKVFNFFKAIRDKIKNVDLKNKIDKLQNENDALRKASDIANADNERKIKELSDQLDIKQDEITRDNARFNKLFKQMTDSQYLYFDANNYINIDKGSSMQSMCNVINKVKIERATEKDYSDFDQNDADTVNKSLASIFNDKFNDCFETEKISVPVWGHNLSMAPDHWDEIEIYNGFQGYGSVVQEIMDKEKEVLGKENDFTYVAKQLDKMYNLDNITSIEKVSNYCTDMLKSLNDKLAIHGYDKKYDWGIESKETVQIIRATTNTLSGMIKGLAYICNIAVSQHSFLVSTSKQLLTIVEALKDQRPGEAERILKNSPLHPQE